MSGITGLYYLDDQPVERYKLEQMIAALAHRGLAGSALWIGSSTGLGQVMQMTSSAPLEENKSLVSGPFVLAADARLDNREELICTLGLGDAEDATVSDQLLILRAYERWGELCLDHLLGAFAFALWDARRQVLFCARDHLGIKPFFYYSSSEVFAFASEIKALFTLPEIPRHLKELSIANYLLLNTQDQASSFYKDIVRLPPAHAITVSPKGVNFRPYWALDLNKEVFFDSDEAYAAQYKKLFIEAVGSRLRNSSPVGVMLSGGLDSSSIACVARTLWEDDREDLHTFSLVFDDVPESDESSYIQSVIRGGHLEPYYIHGDRLNVLSDLDRMLWHLDEPFLGPNLFFHWGMYESASQQGVHVLLDGLLGDSVVGHGDNYLTQLASEGRLWTFLKEISIAAKLQHKPKKAAWHLTRRYALAPLIMHPLRQAWARLSNSPKHESFRYSCLNSEFAAHQRENERSSNQKSFTHSVRSAHYAELTSGLLTTALEVVDKASAAFNLDIRYPFADRRLMEYCLALPPTQKYRAGWTRYVARNAMQDYLPEEVHMRYDKGNLGRVFRRNLRLFSEGELRTFLFERLQIAAPYVNTQVLQQAFLQLIQGEEPPEAPMLIWQAVVLTRWLEQEKAAANGTHLQTNHRCLQPLA